MVDDITELIDSGSFSNKIDQFIIDQEAVQQRNEERESTA